MAILKIGDTAGRITAILLHCHCNESDDVIARFSLTFSSFAA